MAWVVFELTWDWYEPLRASARASCYLFTSEFLLKLRPNKTERAPHWKSASQHSETCVALPENSHAVNHGLQENTQQRLAGTEGLHTTEPFSHTFLSVDINFKARQGDLFCQMGWVADQRGGQ